MEIRSFVAEELGNSSYLILVPEASLAAAIDPMRDVAPCLEMVERADRRLAWALETHAHNDFVCGARELEAEAGAMIGASAQAGLHYVYEPLRDGQEIGLGPYRLRVLATAGHTPEHVSYLLVDKSGGPFTLFSGGSLIIGTAARPDLLGPASSWRLARMLHHSPCDRLGTLPDDVQVLPTHGAGSFRASGASPPRSTTIGAEAEFIALARLGRLAAAPRASLSLVLVADTDAQEAKSVRQLARIGYDLVMGRLEGGFDAWPAAGRPVSSYPRITAARLEAWLLAGESLVVVDVRQPSAWFAGRIPGSVNVPLYEIPQRGVQLPIGPTLAVHCGYIYRGILGASLLQQVGRQQLVVVGDG